VTHGAAHAVASYYNIAPDEPLAAVDGWVGGLIEGRGGLVGVVVGADGGACVCHCCLSPRDHDPAALFIQSSIRLTINTQQCGGGGGGITRPAGGAGTGPPDDHYLPDGRLVRVYGSGDAQCARGMYVCPCGVGVGGRGRQGSTHSIKHVPVQNIIGSGAEAWPCGRLGRAGGHWPVSQESLIGVHSMERNPLDNYRRC
jgi:hypothetical protein